MLHIVRENVHRIVEDSDFERRYKSEGFAIVKETTLEETKTNERKELEEKAKANGVGYSDKDSSAKIASKIADVKAANGFDTVKDDVEYKEDAKEVERQELIKKLTDAGERVNPNIGLTKVRERVQALEAK